MIFKKKINILEEENVIQITVYCDKQMYVVQETKIFQEDVLSLIPEKYLGKIKLIKAPDKPISNINKDKYTNIGYWEFKIVNQPSTRQRKTRNNRKTEATNDTRSKKN